VRPAEYFHGSGIDTFSWQPAFMKRRSVDTLPFIRRYLHLAVTGSTNTFALSQSDLPADGLLVIRADRQSAGRGQRGASFFSDTEGGLWVSVVTPIADLDDHFIFNRAISTALADTLLKRCPGAPVAVKWPNDIYWGSRKICGILMETATPATTHIVIGFGLNVNIAARMFPPHLRSIATSVQIETGRRTGLDALLVSILTAFDSALKTPPELLHGHYTGLLYRQGDTIEIGGKRGVFGGVDIDGALMLETDSGVERVMSGSINFME
jgi:BirA family biotin operon repressor/biotin-[acetyl-CoA-carboxylase] ligase